MRYAIFMFLCLTAGPAAAWQFTPGLPCKLTHETAEVFVEVTFDPRGPLYTISLTKLDPWPDAPVFTMRYNGPFGVTISTDQHQLSQEGRTLSVSDRGFGNLLTGFMQDNAFTARAGDAVVTVPLDGAAGPTSAFAACRPAAGA